MEDIVYSEKYLDIINTAKQRQLTKDISELYVERHHIIPKCVEPELEFDETNIVCLTPKEHFEAHKELSESNPDNISLAYAWMCMCSFSNESCSTQERYYDISSDDYAYLRNRFHEISEDILNLNFKWHNQQTLKNISPILSKQEIKSYRHKAMRDLNKSAFIMWIEFSELETNTEFKLSKVYFERECGISDKSYTRAKKELEEKGYILWMNEERTFGYFNMCGK